MNDCKITKIVEQLPHLTIPLINGNVMVVPILYIESIIDNTQEIPNGETANIMIRSIIKEWYERMKNE